MDSKTHVNRFLISLRIFLLFAPFLSGIDRVFAQTGQLTVTSQPSGALIWLDDREIGNTPLYNLDVKAGFHTLRLVDPSTGAAATRTVQIIADSLVSLSTDIGSSSGFLNVESKPKGAEVSLVTVLGKTPIHNAPINPGAYSIKVEHPRKSYGKVIEDAVITENNPQKIEVALPKNRWFIGKTTARIFLGAASIGLYAWGFSARGNDNKVGSIIGFTSGTVCLIGVELFSF